ncbi:tetratricopeptide repeat protein [Colwellia psychrerythraea]|uniref:TPR domain protein n=1 Tax=Colwellia psychrerythraea TaxID=28229 RepID=A0A099KYV0_COLPS|nr:hypothetical protein [Colwellia psychrerythraea]KGJ94823.1 hypothetical protein GAB14E_2057 [Colwellia psychrerythraea]
MKATVTNLFVHFIYVSLFSFGLFVSTYCAAAEVKNYQNQLAVIDKAHQEFTNDFYNKIIKTAKLKAARFNSLEALSQAIINEINLKKPIKATALIIRNQFLLTRNYYDPKVILLIKQLLDNNVLINAQDLISKINDQGDDGVNAQLSYLLADFYFQRKNWPKVLTYLKDNMSELPIEQYHHAQLMTGISLQKQGEHHRSIKAYEKVVASSEYYAAAQFNMALANIRQGWWTDGHQIISQLLTSQETENKEKALNRLYITLGYSLLNQAYYRNARKTFQLVGLNSRYSNQALLGIALTAAHQDDYIGALNATRFLKDKKQDDLPIDEAYLLMPFFYEKSQQLATASLGYSQASGYYQDKINSMNRLINSPLILKKATMAMSENSVMSIANANSDANNKTRVDFLANYPKYFFSQRQNMLAFKDSLTRLNKPQISKKITALNDEYENITIMMAKSIMQNRVSQLSSYLNQSRYGLARLYDNNTVEQ